MTFDKFTIKAQEAVQSAINIAQRNGQQTIEPVHILAGVMEKGKDVINYVFQKLGVNAQAVESAIQNEICLLYTSPSPRDRSVSRMPSSA